MIAGGRIQDKYGPKVGATLGGLFLAAGCIIAGMMKSYEGLLIGFGVLGGIGMGIGYAAPTPAALKWFGPHKRGLIAGLVVGGYGGAALYISPLAQYLLNNYGISGSFNILGIFFAVVVLIAGQLLAWPPAGYVPPPPPVKPGSAAAAKKAMTAHDWAPGEMLTTWQYYALVILFIGSTQSGLMIIANAAKILAEAAKADPFLAANAWILASFGGLINALGRVGTGMYSDKIWPRERIHPQLPRFGGLPLRHAVYRHDKEHLPALPGYRYRLLAVRRRTLAPAGLYGGLLRRQEHGLQLRSRVPRVGIRFLHGETGRNDQGYDGQPRLCLLYFSGCSCLCGRRLPYYEAASLVDTNSVALLTFGT
ncbi:MAG: MFS transporter [Desulfobacterales bacterium]|nr:MFS transporter [Desulfobacterales bacterium]